ncbi:MAG: M4 family metallopeptidase, partial [Saprospiraceae bacterium]
MKTFTSILFLLFSITWINAQTSFKHIVNHPGATPQPLQIAAGLPSMKTNARQASGFFKTNMGNIISTNPSIASQKITSSGSFWITMHDNQLWASRSSLNDLMGQLIPNSVFKKDLSMEWSEVSQEADVNHVAHIRLEQMFAGKPIHGQDMILHIRDGQVRDLNGFAWTGNTPEKLPETIPVSTAMNVSKQYLKNKGIQFQPIPQLAGITTSEDNAALVWYPVDGKLVLTYEINMHPNMLDHWTLFVNASSMEIVNAYSLLCSIFPSQLYKLPVKSNFMVRPDMAFNTFNSASAILGDGPTTISDQDLLGINRTVNAYLIGSNFFMIDASRAAMFNATQSVIPNEPNGAIWTLDGQNGSPQKSNFTVIQVSNSNNNWTNLQVSAHSNAGIAFEYYKNTFNRLSINGTGGNIISLINIADENGNAMDNAYWNGSAMFYGNGDQAFIFPLAKALDVSGHELSHGVIQNTANLDYENQSGALNESFADVFG